MHSYDEHAGTGRIPQRVPVYEDNAAICAYFLSGATTASPFSFSPQHPPIHAASERAGGAMNALLADERRRAGGSDAGKDPRLGAGKLPGAASLYEQLDKELMVCLRDGRNFKGFLRSFDQYANLVLDNTVERLTAEDEYADIPLGIFIVRGENVMLLGEVDSDRETEYRASRKRVTEAAIRAKLEAQRDDKHTVAYKQCSKWPIPEEP
eukprot:IDg20463t1